MPVILLALVALAAVAIVIFWFMRANPSTLARVLRPILVVLGGIGIAGLLIFGIRFLPGLLPELFGLAGGGRSGEARGPLPGARGGGRVAKCPPVAAWVCSERSALRHDAARGAGRAGPGRGSQRRRHQGRASPPDPAHASRRRRQRRSGRAHQSGKGRVAGWLTLPGPAPAWHLARPPNCHRQLLSNH